jgi:hypothetical protein
MLSYHRAELRTSALFDALVAEHEHSIHTSSLLYTTAALLRGGAIFASAGTVTISHCAFAHNYAVLDGGDCNVRHGAQLTVTSSTFVGSASGGSGGSIAACGASVEQCVFEGASIELKHT